MRDYFKLLQFVKPYKLLFILAAIFIILETFFQGFNIAIIVPIADPLLTGKDIIFSRPLPSFLNDFIQKVNNMPRDILLVYIVVLLPILFLLRGVVEFFKGYFMSDIGQRVMRDIRSKLYNKLSSLSLDFYSRKKGGGIISRITNDVRMVENAVSYGFTDLIFQSMQVIMFTFIIFYLDLKLSLVAFVVFPLISFPIVKVGRKIRKLSKKSQEQMADINSSIYETIFGIRIIKAFSMEDYERNKFDKFNFNFYKVMMKSIKRMLLLPPVTEFIGAIGGIFVFFWLGRKVIAGESSFGVFGLYIGSILSLIRPFKKLSQVNSIIQQALAANTRIYEVLNSPIMIKEKSDSKKLGLMKYDIMFENVSFRYDDKIILNNINFKVEKGKKVAIVGPSGVGKTTLVDLVPRFYDPIEGRILIDGQDIRSVTLGSLRGQIGIVTQETVLFNDTVLNNIAYGCKGALFDSIRRAAQDANADDFISKLPNGYDTVIGDRGFRLSGGEKQRIAIARAILKNPPILILDEATSQLDTESERLVQQALEKLIKGRTVFIIAHRLSTIKDADLIIVLEKGRIVQMDRHQQLIEAEGLYKRLYQMQSFQQ